MTVSVVTDAGCNEIRDWLAGSAATAPTHLACGDDDTDPTVADTTMTNELSRAAFDTTTTANKQVKYTMILDSTEENGNTLKEAGLFNAASNGDMFFHGTHASVSKSATVEVEYEITLRVTQ